MTRSLRFPSLFHAAATAATLVALVVTAGCAPGSRLAGIQPAGPAVPAKAGSSASYIAALNGGLIRTNAGIKLAVSDRQRALEAEYRALEAAPGGQPVVWQGGNVRGSVVAAAPYQVGSQNCRQYSHTVVAGAAETVARGVACRNAGGTWTPLT